MSALSHASSKPLAILCDYDGTLVDTENIWIDVETDMMAARGVKWTREQGRELSGSNERHASEVMLAALGIPDASDAAIAELSLERSKLAAERVRALPLPWRPGAERLLETVYEAGIPCALVSASIALVLEAGVSRMKPNRFACVVDGEMVTRGKPAPDAYLLAAGRLGFAARDCLVIEDSPGGTAAGRASGAVVLAVPDQVPLEAHPGQVVLPSLEGLTMAGLRDVFSEGAATRRGFRGVLA